MSGPCTHRWRIAEPNGPTAPGICRLCGERRDFPTAHEGPSPARHGATADADVLPFD